MWATPVLSFVHDGLMPSFNHIQLEICHAQATKEDFAYRHAHSKMTQNFRVIINLLAWLDLAWLAMA